MKSKYGIYKVRLASFNLKLLQIEENTKQIISNIRQASLDKVSVLVFSELCLTGYTANDLFLNKNLFDKVKISLEEIKKEVNKDLVVFVGGHLIYKDKIYNVSYVFSNYQLVGIVGKTYLPNYGEFYEKRWFSSIKEIPNKNIDFLNQKDVPIGNDLIFEFGDDLKIGCEICEDLFVINPPSNNYSLNGANLIVNLSASSEIISKKEYRENLIYMTSSKNYVGYLYNSSSQGESSQDLVFSNCKMIVEAGTILNRSYTDSYIDGLIDIFNIENQRLKYKSSFEQASLPCRYIKIETSNSEIDLLPNKVNPYPFILLDLEKRRERSKQIISLQAQGLILRLVNSHFQKVVIGISGGLDSCLALLVIIEAFKKLNLDPKNIICVSMPGFATSKLTYSNSKKLIQLANATYLNIDIKKSCLQQLKDINHPTDVYDTTYENLQARTRTSILMNLANQNNALVIGTGDLSELALGFATYNGDHMSNYGVNSSIPKTLIKSLVLDYGYYHKEFEKVLSSIVNTPISPELIPSKDKSISQKTEQIIGKYDLHDFFLYQFMRNNASKEKIYQLAKIAFNNLDEKYIKDTLDIFFKRFFTNQFKRSCLPDGVKVGTISLSPRGDFRMASDIDYKNSLNSDD